MLNISKLDIQHPLATSPMLYTCYFINYKTSQASRQYKLQSGARRLRVRWSRWFIIIITATARPSILALLCIFNVDGLVPGSCTGSYITDSFVQAVTKRCREIKFFPPRNRSVVGTGQARALLVLLFSFHPLPPLSFFFLSFLRLVGHVAYLNSAEQ